MDWSKAKVILIVFFIVVNILLLISIIQNNQEKDPTLQKDFIYKTKEILSNKGIKVNTEIPKEKSFLNALTVEFEDIEAEDLNKYFFNNKGDLDIKNEEFIEIIYKDESITLINEKLIIYKSENENQIYNIKNKDDAIKIAKEFLESKNINTKDMKLSYIKKKEDKYYLEFSKIYEDRYVESAFTNIQLDNTGVNSMERLWLEPIEVGESPIYIDNAPKALLGLISKSEVYGKSVKDISLSYYFDPEKHEYIQEPEVAKRGRTIPAWRIQFEDGYKIFIDSY